MCSGHVRTIHALNRDELAVASQDRSWPKWSTMCQLRLLRLPVLNGTLVTPDADVDELRLAIAALVKVVGGTERLMIRSDGGVEKRQYYRGGNSFPINQVERRAKDLLEGGRAVILLESTNRFTNHLTVQFRLERDIKSGVGRFTVEALGPGYDVADLTRGDVEPQVTVSVEGVDWGSFMRPWWSDLQVERNMSPEAEMERRRRRLIQISAHLRTLGEMSAPPGPHDPAAAAAWLRSKGYGQLFDGGDPSMRVIRETVSWFETAFLIAIAHPMRNWRCLAVPFSDMGGGRFVYWDIVDGTHKYSMA